VKYEIEIELPPEIAEEWEPVRFGVPATGENYLYGGVPVVAYEVKSQRMVIRRKHVWPRWIRDMGAKWAAMDEDGGAWVYALEPQEMMDGWRNCDMESAWRVDPALLPSHEGMSWPECIWEIK
jgi:hypothetical protein